MDRMAGQARKKYRQLVYENPAFLQFWNEVTPLDEIKRLTIGSRPTARKSTSERSLVAPDDRAENAEDAEEENAEDAQEENAEENDEDEKQEEEKKTQYQVLWKLFHLVKRSKIILGTATPMINDVNEIAPVMNL